MAKIVMPMPQRAVNPDPADTETAVPVGQTLTWEPNGYARIEGIGSTAKITVDQALSLTVDLDTDEGFPYHQNIESPEVETLLTTATITPGEAVATTVDVELGYDVDVT